MTKPVHRRRSRLRRFFLWCGLLIFIAALALVGFGFYLTRRPVPDFLKEPLLTRLRAEGVQLDFSRMQWRWPNGIVVENAVFTWLKSPRHPTFSSDKAEINLDFETPFAAGLPLRSLTIKHGNLLWPVSKTNDLSMTFSNIAMRLVFQPNEQIEFTHLEGDFAGARVKLTGALTNALALRDWEMFQPKKKKKGKSRLNEILLALQKIQFTETPELELNFSGDGADPKSFRGTLHFAAVSAQTPWGSAKKIVVNAELPDLLNTAENNFAHVTMDFAETQCGTASNLNAQVKLLSLSSNQTSFATEIKLSAQQLRTEPIGTPISRSASGESIWFTTEAIEFEGKSSQWLTNLVPFAVSGTANFAEAESKWGRAKAGEIIFEAATNTAPRLADESWAAWSKAEPFFLNWQGTFSSIETPKLQIEKISLGGTWRAPELQITNLNAQLYDGAIEATARLNVATREAALRGTSDFDAQKIAPLLTPYGQRWIRKFTWEKPPQVEGVLTIVLPAWTNRAPNWREDVLPSLDLRGHVSAGRGSYRKATATGATTDFIFTNRIWNLPNLHVQRPEGDAELKFTANDRTREYHWTIDSEMNPAALRLWLTNRAQLELDNFQFDAPPKLRGEIFGRWNETTNISFFGEIEAQQFFYRSNLIDRLKCSVFFTNQHLAVSDLQLNHGEKSIDAVKVEVDFPTKKVFFTNVHSTVDPYLVAELIGRKVAKNIAPYQFAAPPTIDVNGSITIGKTDDADLHFVVDGARFRWTNFVMDKISGRIDWVGKNLLLTNVQAQAYGEGRIAGWSHFDFATTNGADLRFDVAVADADLQTAVRSYAGKTNRLEGWLHGNLQIDAGHTGDFKSWRGHGRVNLRDGLIWDEPLFGIFSPLLNAILPGAGNSRAREASATFVVHDGIIYSDDLEIRAATLRLAYRGQVDFQKRVDARVEAEFLRDVWVVGPLVSLILKPFSKIFEYKVTGSLSDPETEPVYIPNFVMMTLRPFNTLKKIFAPDKEETRESESAPTPNP